MSTLAVSPIARGSHSPTMAASPATPLGAASGSSIVRGRRSRLAVGIGTLGVLTLLAACSATPAQPGAAPTTSMPSTPASAPASAPAGGGQADAATLALAMADNPLGEILVDGKGMTLYLFTKDSPNTSACEGQCLVNWPPLLGEPTAGMGVDDSKLGSFTRTDGRVQATYNDWPLNYWKNDAAPGDATGQKVQDVWFVLDRDGEAIKG